MRQVHIHLLAICIFLGLVAFKPWKSINQHIGVRNVADSLAIAGEQADSMVITEPTNFVLPQAVVDTLVAATMRKDSLRKVLLKKAKELDEEIAQIQAKNIKKQSNLVSEKEIEKLLTRQNKARSPTYEPDRPK
ncbi:hypothetical protein [Spirosoma sp.]|uniref:hypothetical protein n=1 Tax=Spirosoma sp. TaxID=1899569 RepID=UPI0026302D78|nr:hypothetical protein [Spirosoma sp.]MCX6217597.1 hypothetical protein [Spirosoma sp.]